MFDIGFTELLIIGVVALIVIGPERLPKVARTAGHLLGRLQRYVSDVKSDISREMHLEELRKMQTEVQQSAREMELSINKEVSSVESSLNEAIQPPAEPALAEAPAEAAPAPSAPGPEASPQLELELPAPAADSRHSA